MRKLLSSLNLHVMPVVIWALALACVVGLFQQRWRRFEIVGLAQSRIHEIAATTTGRVKSIPVRLFEEVGPGQILAVLDDEPLQADRKTDFIARYRQFANDVERTRGRILELRAILEPDLIMLEDLQLEVKIAQELLEKDAVAPYDLQRAQAAYNALAKKIEENQLLLDQFQRDLKKTEQRRDEFAKRQSVYLSPDSVLAIAPEAIEDQERQIEKLLAERAALRLKSPCEGIVSQIFCKPGEAVLAGAPILTIAEAQPTEIIAYADENQAGLLRENMEVQLVKTNLPAQIATAAQITHVGPTVEPVPLRLLRNPLIPQWGRPFLVKIPLGLELTPGELVGVRGL
jgi:multidrug resistance efflux pump